MTKKKDKQMYWIIGIIAIIVFAYGGNQGWFSEVSTTFSTVTNTDTINMLENIPTQTEECSLTISPSTIDYGGSFTGTVSGAQPRVFCETYAKYLGVWQKVWEGNTDINGFVSATDNLYLVGDFEFKSICGTCVTNSDYLTVNPEVIGDCTDSDGINKMTAGWVIADGLYYYDSCVDDVVTEYWCDGDSVSTRTLPCDIGYECVFTRSGDYCSSVGEEPPLDSDGDGFSDEDEELAGTNPNDSNSYPGGPAESCADECNAIGFAGSYYDPISSENGCMGYGYDTCFPVFGLQFEDSTYIDECCCFRCVGW